MMPPGTLMRAAQGCMPEIERTEGGAYVAGCACGWTDPRPHTPVSAVYAQIDHLTAVGMAMLRAWATDRAAR